MSTFVDELLWIRDGQQVVKLLLAGPLTPQAWGPTLLRHPGVPAAIAGGLAGRSRNLDKDRVVENERIIAAARYGIVWTGLLACLLVTLLGARLYDAPTGLVAGSILAASPFHIGNSAWLQCDSALTTFSIGCVLMSLIRMRGGGKGWVLGSGTCAGLAVASKLPGLVLVPFVGLLFGTSFILRLVKQRRDGLEPLWDLGRWSALCLLTLYLAWPRMWLNPVELWQTVAWGLQLGKGHLNYFMGSITSSPPWYYYLVIVPFKLSSFESVGLIATASFAVTSAWRRRWPRAETLLLIMWGVLFLLALSFSGKKLGARYVLPLWPVMALVVARFVVVVARPLLSRRALRLRLGAVAAATVVFFISVVVTLASTAPHFIAHTNSLLGGLATLNRISLVGGIAERDVARYLDTLPAGERVRIAAVGAHIVTLRWHARRKLEEHSCGAQSSRTLTSNPPGYLVVFSYHERRCPSAAPAELIRLGAREIRTFDWKGVVLCRVYRFGTDAAHNRVESNSSASEYVNLSLQYYNRGEYGKSIEAGQKALNLDPANAMAYNNICVSNIWLEQWEEAIAACQKAVSLDPTNQRYQNNLDWVHRAQANN